MKEIRHLKTMKNKRNLNTKWLLLQNDQNADTTLLHSHDEITWNHVGWFPAHCLKPPKCSASTECTQDYLIYVSVFNIQNRESVESSSFKSLIRTFFSILFFFFGGGK